MHVGVCYFIPYKTVDVITYPCPNHHKPQLIKGSPSVLRMTTLTNGNISALLTLCVGNSPVTGEFPSQRPVTHSFDVFFDLRLNKRLSKQSMRLWFETPSHLLWLHFNGMIKILPDQCLDTPIVQSKLLSSFAVDISILITQDLYVTSETSRLYRYILHYIGSPLLYRRCNYLPTMGKPPLP